MNKELFLKNAHIILKDKEIKNGFIKIVNDKIVLINDMNQFLKLHLSDNKKIIDLKHQVLMPGFIDPHVHGGYNHDFETSSKVDFSDFATKIAQEGVTSFCQATVTQSFDVLKKSFQLYQQWLQENKSSQTQAKQIGIHMEGPFLSKEKKGAHKLSLLQQPNQEMVAKLIKASGNNIKVITYALELDDLKLSFSKFLHQNHILASIGHSNILAKEFLAKYQKVKIHQVTHLHNGMSTYSHFTTGHGKEAGLVTAALLADDVYCELISDGIHNNKETVALTYKIKGYQKIILITDAMKAKGLKNGFYKLGPLDVYKDDYQVTLKDSNLLAGSVAKFDHCFRKFKEFTNANYVQMSHVSSLNAAKQLQVDHLVGSIEINKDADLVCLDNDDQVVLTISKGKIIFQKNV